MAVRFMMMTATVLLAASAAAQDPPAASTEKERLSYALGMSLGDRLRKYSVELDIEAYGQGLRDALSGSETRLTESEARALVAALQNDMRPKLNAAPRPAAGGRNDLAAASALADIDVSFRLDPRLTRSLYMGERWLPLPFTQAGGKERVVIHAKAQGRDGGRRPVNVNPRWIPDDPAWATVEPQQGEVVTITVKRPGESGLRVTSEGITRELFIRAAYRGEILQVEISRKTS